MTGRRFRLSRNERHCGRTLSQKSKLAYFHYCQISDTALCSFWSRSRSSHGATVERCRTIRLSPALRQRQEAIRRFSQHHCPAAPYLNAKLTGCISLMLQKAAEAKLALVRLRKHHIVVYKLITFFIYIKQSFVSVLELF